MKTVILSTFIAFFLYFVVLVLLWVFMEVIPEWHRKLKVNRRIVRQAKAAGVWGNLDTLGGQALTLYAWKHWAIDREEGETDAQLRRRIYCKIKEKP